MSRASNRAAAAAAEKAEEVNKEVETNTAPAPEEKEVELVTLSHFVKNGSLTVDGVTYQIKDGKVKVKPEHAGQVKRHIAMGG